MSPIEPGREGVSLTAGLLLRSAFTFCVDRSLRCSFQDVEGWLDWAKLYHRALAEWEGSGQRVSLVVAERLMDYGDLRESNAAWLRANGLETEHLTTSSTPWSAAECYRAVLAARP